MKYQIQHGSQYKQRYLNEYPAHYLCKGVDTHALECDLGELQGVLSGNVIGREQAQVQLKHAYQAESHHEVIHLIVLEVLLLFVWG